MSNTKTTIMPSYNYMEIIDLATGKLLKRANLTAHSAAARERIANSTIRNNNPEKSVVKTFVSDKKLPAIN